MTQPQKKFAVLSWLQLSSDQYYTLRIALGHQYLQNVYLGILFQVNSGQVNFVTLPYEAWEKILNHILYFKCVQISFIHVFCVMINEPGGSVDY